MSATFRQVQLTDLQLSHTIAALQRDLERLLALDDDQIVGGEHEDCLILQSVLAALKQVKRDNP